MVRLPRDVSPGAGARRALLADSLVALLLAAVAILLAAGIGVVGFVALLVLLVLLLCIGVEAGVRRWAQRGKARERPSRERGRPPAPDSH
jgi:NhaP-type Na+/H+ or K+/H+ antiporter